MSNNKDLYAGNSTVIELNYTDHSKLTNSNKLTINHPKFRNTHGFIMFYAPWCGHCKTSVGMWNKLANLLEGVLTVGAVNSDNTIGKNNLFIEQVGVQGFPTIKFVDTNGFILDYTGNRTIESLLDFVCKKTGECSINENKIKSIKLKNK